MKGMRKGVKARPRVRHSVFGIVGLAFQKLFDNALIMLPFLFSFIAAIVIIAIVILITLGIGGLALLDIGIAETEIEKLIPTLFSTFVTVIVVFAIGLLAVWLINCYFYSGAIGMALEIGQGKKTSLRTLGNAGKCFWFKYWLISLIVGLFMVIWLVVFSLPAILTLKPIYLIIPLLSLVPALFIFILFVFSYVLLVIYNLTVWQAIRKSVEFVKANYWPVLGLTILYLLMAIVVSLIPWIGGIISTIVIMPSMTIAFVLFVLERQK